MLAIAGSFETSHLTPDCCGFMLNIFFPLEGVLLFLEKEAKSTGLYLTSSLFAEPEDKTRSEKVCSSGKKMNSGSLSQSFLVQIPLHMTIDPQSRLVVML
ncbi:hypothetical protein TRICI_005982 [Trichomonascus ciferrii]|uniref:Uncharacterized protein n=1 Tax=Trichomonascus ciferrii TaxID=44093 RepID=A0A642UU70_9ASCO|nr:hypothetical protein TRICI_005982 [Trichomonascus ciferrii]